MPKLMVVIYLFKKNDKVVIKIWNKNKKTIKN